jgi:hypothetical protein
MHGLGSNRTKYRKLHKKQREKLNMAKPKIPTEKCKCGHERKMHALPDKHVNQNENCTAKRCNCKKYEAI